MQQLCTVALKFQLHQQIMRGKKHFKDHKKAESIIKKQQSVKKNVIKKKPQTHNFINMKQNKKETFWKTEFIFRHQNEM